MTDEKKDSRGTVAERKRIALTDSGKKIPLTDEMIELRNGIARGLGHTLGPCSFVKVPRKDGTPHKPPCQCWEQGTWMIDGIEVGARHTVAVSRGEGFLRLDGYDIYGWPDEVMKAAKTIDREGKPERKRKPWEMAR